MSFEIVPLAPEHRSEWEQLARGYKTFYETQLPDAAYARTWNRLMSADGIHGFGAHDDGRLVGITHYLFHTGTWTNKSCYLEDLFVDPACRGRGIARGLIEAVARRAREEGAGRLYWLTHQHNETARMLYDHVARFSGFVEYEYPL
ncbi:MAG: GNAT family N-acetyltransferase [Steroidobacteraceae bacterium]|nr:GNAT family N-acetyltransferase [Steroidobacteraceae bacterium]